MDETTFVLKGENEFVVRMLDCLQECGFTVIKDASDCEMAATLQNKMEIDDLGATYNMSPEVIIPVSATLVGAGGLSSVLVAYLQSHQKEFLLKFDDKGNVVEIQFKNFNRESVGEIIADIKKYFGIK